MLYQAASDADLMEEYLRRPKGPHSPELQAYLKALLADPATRNAVIVNLVPFRVWALASLPQDRSLRVRIERERLFDSEDEAERALFLRRLEMRRSSHGRPHDR